MEERVMGEARDTLFLGRGEKKAEGGRREKKSHFVRRFWASLSRRLPGIAWKRRHY